MQVAEVELLGTGAPVDVTQPGDAIIASSSNSPGSEGVANAIDNQQTKYLNFDSRTPEPIRPSGFVVTPSIGATVVIGMTIQSANDAPERDPKTVTLEGSNDATVTDFASGNWQMITTINVPDFTARFQKQEFFFSNQRSYKHYRWTVTETRTANGCCMQVAEVELLAVPQGADCSKARFTLQPVDTPVLSGQPATFYAAVNGPWPVQWLRNGQPIPGATLTTYTTPNVTAANANDTYALQILGCETSAEVRAVIFTPSATKSIGISFVGGGANGAPTTISPNNVIGIVPQAYWNNAAGGGGDLPGEGLDPDGNPVPIPLLDSDGNESTMYFNWVSGGTWGSGTGVDAPVSRMLNGLVGANGPGNIGTFTFSDVPAGNHSLIVYSVSPPLQFQVVSFNVGNTTYFMRSLNSDEHNAAPGFYRGTSTDRNNPTVGNFVRFDNVQAVGGQIILSTETLTPGFDRQTGVNGLQLILNSAAAGAPPAITTQPQPTVAALGKTARLTVQATGQGLTYQWRKNGRNLPNGGNISGATTATLTIDSVSEADVAVYSVAVFNPSGSVISRNAALGLSQYNINDRLVGYWKFDESGGTTVANSAAGGQAGQINGSGTFGAGRVGNALTLDGASYIFVPNYTKAKAAIAGSAWVNIDPGTSTDVAIFRNAQGAMTVSGGAGRIVGQFEVGLVYDETLGAVRPMAAVGIGPNVARATGPSAFPTGQWANIAFSADGAQLRLYVNGQEVAVVDYLAEINPPDVPYISMGARLNLDSSEPPVLGADESAPNYLAGRIDEVALWTRSLTADEAGKIYAAGNQGQALSTVVITPPPDNETPPEITVARSGNTLTLAWQGSGFQLQVADAVNGQFGAVQGAGPNSATITIDGNARARFYRLVK